MDFPQKIQMNDFVPGGRHAVMIWHDSDVQEIVKLFVPMQELEVGELVCFCEDGMPDGMFPRIVQIAESSLPTAEVKLITNVPTEELQRIKHDCMRKSMSRRGAFN